MPVGVALVGGLLVSQTPTLFSIPVIYLFLDRINDRVVGGMRRTLAPPAGAA